MAERAAIRNCERMGLEMSKNGRSAAPLTRDRCGWTWAGREVWLVDDFEELDRSERAVYSVLLAATDTQS